MDKPLTINDYAATGNMILSLPVSGDALTIASAQVLRNHR